MAEFDAGVGPSSNEMVGTLEGVDNKVEPVHDLGLRLTLSPEREVVTPVRTVPEMKRTLP